MASRIGVALLRLLGRPGPAWPAPSSWPAPRSVSASGRRPGPPPSRPPSRLGASSASLDLALRRRWPWPPWWPWPPSWRDPPSWPARPSPAPRPARRRPWASTASSAPAATRSGGVPEKSDGEVGTVRSVKSSQSARTTSCAESSACVVIEASGMLRSESATSISSLASTHRTVPLMRSFCRITAAARVSGSSICQSSSTMTCPVSAMSLSAESRARRIIFFGVRCS